MQRGFVISTFLLCSFVLLTNAGAAEKVPDNVTLKLKGAKMKAVNLSHLTHVQKLKLDCVLCHHGDKNPNQPQKCTACHPESGAKTGIPEATGAFHKQCQSCHKESIAKNVPAPTKCVECHKD